MEPGRADAARRRSSAAAARAATRAWLLVQVLRHLGLAARFVSGYLIQLVADVKPLDGPAGPPHDFTDLHAWTEVYLPGRGLGRARSDVRAACRRRAHPARVHARAAAAPRRSPGVVDDVRTSSSSSRCASSASTRTRASRSRTPTTSWRAIDALGRRVDARARRRRRAPHDGRRADLRVDRRPRRRRVEHAGARAETKRRLAGQLVRRLQQRFAPGALLHFGQGKWYPGEPLPRWALGCYWRRDGVPVWQDPRAAGGRRHADATATAEDARRFVDGARARGSASTRSCACAALRGRLVLPVARAPAAGRTSIRSPRSSRTPDERARLARVFERGLGAVVGCVLPLAPDGRRAGWRSGRWMFRAGASAADARRLADGLPPAARLAAVARRRSARDDDVERDPMAPRPRSRRSARGAAGAAGADRRAPAELRARRESVRTALCVEPRDGRLHVFMPPVARSRTTSTSSRAVEDTARDARDCRWSLEGYPPPRDPRLQRFEVTPDPGVIEVNVHPAAELGRARRAARRRSTRRRGSPGSAREKFMLDGRHTGTGGGNHVVLGGATPADSPFLRRPDLLRSLVALLAQSSVALVPVLGPVHRPDEPGAARRRGARRRALRARDRVRSSCPSDGAQCPPWLVDRIFRHLLVDVTGNTHRAEFCIDKLYSPDTATRPARAGRAARLRDAAARAHEPRRSSSWCARSSPASGTRRTASALVRWGTRCTTASCCRTSSGRTSTTCSPSLRARGLRARPRRGSRRTSSSASRCIGTVAHDGVRARAAPGDRAVARAGRGGGRRRHGPLRRFVRRAAAGEGDGHDRRAPRRLPATAAGAAAPDGDGRASTSPASATAPGSRRVPASDDPGARAAGVRPRRHLGGALARRLHVPRRAPGRAQLRDVPGERERGRGAPRRALLPSRPHPGPDDAAAAGTATPSSR